MKPSQDEITAVHEEIAQEAHHEAHHNHHEHKHWLRRFFKHHHIVKGVFGIIALILISSVFLIGPNSQEIIGRIGTAQLQEGELQAQNISIVFVNESASTMNYLYATFQQEQGLEIAACMIGTKEENTYTISQILIPDIISQKYNHVTFSTCPTESLIWFHTHPQRKCVASQTDLNTLESVQRRNSDAIMMIMCEDNRFRIIE